MAINLSHSLYGAQFETFRAIASNSSLAQDALVSVDDAGRGKGLLNTDGERRAIVVKDGDSIIVPRFGGQSVRPVRNAD